MNPEARTYLPHPQWRRALALPSDETGATAMEYGLLAALVALAILATLKTLGEDLAGLPLQSIIDAIQAVIA
jgi:Flp pilus assembly pilin Flp